MAKKPAVKEEPVSEVVEKPVAVVAPDFPIPEKTLPTVASTGAPLGTSLSIPTDLEDELFGDAGGGSETIGQEDRLIPFIRIVQSLSPERNKTKNEFIQGVREGDVFNTVSRKPVSLWGADEEPTGNYLTIVPVSYQRRCTEWWPRDSKLGKGLYADHGSDFSILKRTTKNDKGKDITERGTVVTTSGDYIVFVVDPRTGLYEPAVLSMAGSQLRKARSWNTQLTTLRIPVKGRMIQPPLWYTVWRFTTKAESNDDGSWFGWDIQPAGYIDTLPGGLGIYAEAKKFRTKVETGEVKVGVDDNSAPAESAPGRVIEPSDDDDVPY